MLIFKTILSSINALYFYRKAQMAEQAIRDENYRTQVAAWNIERAATEKQIAQQTAALTQERAQNATIQQERDMYRFRYEELLNTLQKLGLAAPLPPPPPPP